MSEVSIRDLRNHGGDIVDRAARGERLTVTRLGEPVAQLTGYPREPLALSVLRERWAKLPTVDPDRLRDDLDDLLDPEL